MGEAFYSYEQSHKGKTAAQIRAGIIKGEWKSVDATKYQLPLPAKCSARSSRLSRRKISKMLLVSTSGSP
jgi:hypothetical protein